MSDSDEEIVVSKRKTFKIFDDDDESDDDKKPKNSVHSDDENSNHSQEKQSSVSAKILTSDDERSNDSHSSVVSRTTINSESNALTKTVNPSKSGSESSSDSDSSARSNSTTNSKSNASPKTVKQSKSGSESSSDSDSSARSNRTINSKSNASSKTAEPPKSHSESSNDSYSSASSNNTTNSKSALSKASKSQKSDCESDTECMKKGICNTNGSCSEEEIKVQHSSNQNSVLPISKPTGKFSLITESDLESDHDSDPPPRKLSSDSDFGSKPDKVKKLKKKSKCKKSSISKSNGVPASGDSESECEDRPSPKRFHVSSAKSEGKSKAPKTSSKKDKDPLLSIRSETQRLIREGRISLPYHQPKQRTLHEFLQRRKTAPSIPLKATPDLIKTVCEHLSIKEKEVEEFYKSESDHSDNETRMETSPSAGTGNIENQLSKEGSNEAAADVLEPNLEPCDNIREISPVQENVETLNCNLEETGTVAMETKPSNECKDLETPDGIENSATGENIGAQNSDLGGTEVFVNNSPLPSLMESSTTEGNIPLGHEIENDQSERNKLSANEIQSSPCDEMGITVMPDDTRPTAETVPEPTHDTNTEEDPSPIPDSIDFDLTIEDSCNDIDTKKNPSVSDSQKNDLSNHEQAVSIENKTNDRLKRTMDLLSNYNIKLPSVKLNDIPVEIELEIPTSKECETSSYDGLMDLKNKFYKHTKARNEPKKKNSLINVVSTQTNSDGEIIDITKETLVLQVDDAESEFSHPKFSKPGAKRAYFKEKILKDLISKKEAHWNEYQSEKRKLHGSDSEEEKSDDDDETSYRKPNFEPYHPEDEPDDDELIEEDVLLKEKERKKNVFLDEEAEVSDLEDLEDNVDECDGEDEEEECDEDDEEAEDSDGLSVPTHSNRTENNADALKDSSVKSLFKFNITGSDLENKLMGLESVSQKDEDITASQVFGICSGKFASQTVVPTSNVDSEFFSESQNIDDSQNICLTLPDTNEIAENSENAITSANSNRPEFLAESDADGSDNEELFMRRKRALRIEDSDEESDNAENKDEKSDDEDDDDDELEQNEYDAVMAEELGYNSEEEMVPYTSKVAEEFFEKEAELSESEWGSEDENERDLDTLEKEEGDDDEIDNEKLKEELGRIHMRQLLDDDQHDVNVLKEMLLEDGELHSDAKRQRKFQWKNLDGDDFFLNKFNDSDDENNQNDEDENEENWRKVRHERETYLSQQEGKAILNESESIESSFLKQLPNHTKIVNESITKVIHKTAITNVPTENKGDRSTSLKNSQFKGSFLSRGKYLLSKVTLSVAESKENMNGVKNSRNFVFGAVSPKKSSAEVTMERNEKRKSSGTSVAISKKVKLSVENGTNISKREGLLAKLTLLD